MSKINVAVDSVEGFTCAVEDIVTRVHESEIAERAAEMTEALAEVLAELDDRLAALEQWVDDVNDDDEGGDEESDDNEESDDDEESDDNADSEDYYRGYDDGFEDGKASVS